MLKVNDEQAYALLRAIVAAKFSTLDSTVLLGLPALDEVISQILARKYSDERIARLIGSYRGEATHPSGFIPVLRRLQIESDSGLLQLDREAISKRVHELLFPYVPSEGLIGYYISQIV